MNELYDPQLTVDDIAALDDNFSEEFLDAEDALDPDEPDEKQLPAASVATDKRGDHAALIDNDLHAEVYKMRVLPRADYRAAYAAWKHEVVPVWA